MKPAAKVNPRVIFLINAINWAIGFAHSYTFLRASQVE